MALKRHSLLLLIVAFFHYNMRSLTPTSERRSQRYFKLNKVGKLPKSLFWLAAVFDHCRLHQSAAQPSMLGCVKSARVICDVLIKAQKFPEHAA